MSIEDWEDGRDQAGAGRGRAWHGMALRGRAGPDRARRGKAGQGIA